MACEISQHRTQTAPFSGLRHSGCMCDYQDQPQASLWPSAICFTSFPNTCLLLSIPQGEEKRQKSEVISQTLNTSFGFCLKCQM